MQTSCVDRQPLNDSDDRLQQLEAVAKAAQPGYNAAAFLAAIIESSDDAIISKSLAGNHYDLEQGCGAAVRIHCGGSRGATHYDSHSGGPPC